MSNVETTPPNYETKHVSKNEGREREPGKTRAPRARQEPQTAQGGQSPRMPRAPRAGRGPRAARGQVRDKIVRAAHRVFSTHDYQRASMRRIAREAGVDPAMTSYYFPSKAALFREAMSLPEDPAQQVREILEPGVDGLASRLIAAALENWEQASTAGTLATLLRMVMHDADTQRTFDQYFREQILSQVEASLGEDSALLAELVAGSLVGVLMMRYVARIEPLASIPADELHDRLTPIVQLLFTWGFAAKN